MRLTPTPITAALAGIVAGTALSVFWQADDTLLLIVAFLLAVALPAHAFVVGFGPTASARAGVDAALLTRVVVWLVAAGLAIGVVQMFDIV